MNWLEILGAIGGSAGVVALVKVGIDVFNAKSNRTKVDIGNMQTMLDEAHEMYAEMTKKYDTLEKRINEDRESSRLYIDSLRERILKVEDKSQKQEERINNMEKVINVAWRCKYPENVSDCPVIKEYETRHLCMNCANKEK